MYLVLARRVELGEDIYIVLFDDFFFESYRALFCCGKRGVVCLNGFIVEVYCVVMMVIVLILLMRRLLHFTRFITNLCDCLFDLDVI